MGMNRNGKKEMIGVEISNDRREEKEQNRCCVNEYGRG